MSVSNPVAIARACAEAMYSRDTASQELGITIDSVGPGTATLSMVVNERKLNGHGICHGGLIFTLADTAFAFACNSYNVNTVAQHCQISFLAPARLGDRLTAVATEVYKGGRNGLYDIRITNQDGAHIAEFRGASRSIKGTVISEDEGTSTS